jgi:hypothetical protein
MDAHQVSGRGGPGIRFRRAWARTRTKIDISALNDTGGVIPDLLATPEPPCTVRGSTTVRSRERCLLLRQAILALDAGRERGILAAMMARLVVLLLIAGGCASGRSGGGPDSDGRVDAPAGTPGDGAPAIDARIDGPPIDAPGGTGGSGLDPELSLPDPNGQFCDQPGVGAPVCPAGEACRYFTSTEGRCEACTTCGGLGASCTATSQCDILFECYQGQCTGFCTLGSIECGAPTDCIDIGYAARGVCRP